MSGFKIAEAFVAVKSDATGLREEVSRDVKEAGAGQEINVGLKVDKGSLGGLMSNLAPFILPSVQSIGALTGVLGLVPAAAGAAALAYGTLKVGVSGFSDALKTGNTPAQLKAANDALADLSPNARAAALTVRSLGPAWDAVKLDVQNRLFAGTSAVIQQVAKVDLPVLRMGMDAMSGSLNLAAKYTGAWLTSARTTSDVKTIFQDSAVAGGNLARAIQPILGIIRDVGTVGAQFLPQLTSGFATAAQKAADFVSNARDTGKLHEWIQTGIDAMGALWGTFKNLLEIIVKIGTAPPMFGLSFLSILEKVTGLILQLVTNMPQLIPIIEAAVLVWKSWSLAQWAVNAAMDANPIVLVVALVAGLVAAVIVATGHSKDFMDMLSRLWDAIKSNVIPVLKDLWEKIQGQLIPAFEAFVLAMGPVVDFCVRVLGPVVKQIWDAVVSTIKGAISIITGVVQAWTGLLTGNWTLFWQGIRNILSGAWQIIQGVISAALNLVLGLFGTSTGQIAASWTNFWNSVRNTATSVMNSITSFLTGAVNSFKGFWSGAWNGAVDDFNNIFGKVTGIAQTVWNNVTTAFRNGVNAVIGLINRLVDGADVVLKFLLIPLIPHIPGLATGGVLGLAGGGTVGAGFTTNGPMAIVGEGNPNHPEYVIPTDPAHRDSALSLYQSLGAKLMAGGGILDWIGSTVSKVEKWTGDGALGLMNQAVDGLAGGINEPYRDIASSIGHKAVAAIKAMVDKAQAAINAAGSAFSAPFTGSGAVKDWIQQALGLTGTPQSWAGPLSVLIGRESGGNPNAINRTDSNAAAGHPSQGLMQTIPSTFNAYHQAGTSWNITDPVANIAAGINYIKARYGSIFNVQQANPNLPPKGYDSGGLLPTGLTTVYNGTGSPERVLSPEQDLEQRKQAAEVAAVLRDRELAERDDRRPRPRRRGWGYGGDVHVHLTQNSGSPAETGRFVALALRTVG